MARGASGYDVKHFIKLMIVNMLTLEHWSSVTHKRRRNIRCGSTSALEQFAV